MLKILAGQKNGKNLSVLGGGRGCGQFEQEQPGKQQKVNPTPT